LETYFVLGAEFRDGCGEKKEGDKREMQKMEGR